ncbi:mechanosensitive ion channel family protein [Leptothoe spongobia]|uniref:Mechanosensitive ion channel family protein n=1 Tax=Leptothoe spongobia TAU-MAC 1115 TaxID=1967444 RepID=A0A947GJG6_9CYAN|nr:mechanosensitive ion channel family protein [Leptothoe spongobia]MBT9315943.1 mechanosensitive ion channel family protein [Leptothoe spongobia TAU-MAC 1115]
MIAQLTLYQKDIFYIALSLGITVFGAVGLYVVLFHLLRSYFRKFEQDIALVTLNVSAYPGLTLFVLLGLAIIAKTSHSLATVEWLQRLLLGGIIVIISYWCLRLFKQVLIYYLKDYAETTEVMWDEVLLPLLEAIVPVMIILMSGALIMQLCLGLNLTGAWVTLGGSAFIIGFAVKDILANFFSGIALLIDSPFRFGDVLRIEIGNEESSHLGILRKIGVRVTHIYIFELHTEVYIPNSVMQSHKITNLSRPIEPVFFSTPIEFDPQCNLERAKKIMQEILLAHPDTVGNIESKLTCLKNYYSWENEFVHKKENGIQRLLAEYAVNNKLEEVEDALRAMMITLQFVEQGGLTQEEIDTVQTEYDDILTLMGLTVVKQKTRKQSLFNLQHIQPTFVLRETKDPDSLINLVRKWYRIWLSDPNMADEDEYVLLEIWERKIELLKRRTRKLHQKILNPLQEETRLDDYVKELVRWLRDRFKQARSSWHEPEVRMERVVKDEGHTYIRFTLNYYVDDIRLEDGERGARVNSDIHREIMHHLKDDCRSQV